MLRRVVIASLGWLLLAGTSAQAQIEEKKFNVVGTWNFLTNWQVLEVPFWNQDLPKASGGKITANLKSVTELNLKGTEVLRLLKTGVYDFAAALPVLRPLQPPSQHRPHAPKHPHTHPAQRSPG